MRSGWRDDRNDARFALGRRQHGLKTGGVFSACSTTAIPARRVLLEKWPAKGPPLLGKSRSAPATARPPCAAADWCCTTALAMRKSWKCFDAISGQPNWRYGYASRLCRSLRYNNGPRATPLLTEDRCYTFGAEASCSAWIGTGIDLAARHQRRMECARPVLWRRQHSILEGNRLRVMVGGQTNSGVPSRSTRQRARRFGKRRTAKLGRECR